MSPDDPPQTPPLTRRDQVAGWVRDAIADGTARAVMLAYVAAYKAGGADRTLTAMIPVVQKHRPAWPYDDVVELAMEIANWAERRHGRWLRQARMLPDRPYWELQAEAQASLLDHAVATMISNGGAREVALAYLLALNNGQDAERAAVRIIGERNPSLTLGEPVHALRAILAWINEKHGEWWRAALRRAAGNPELHIRELYQTGHTLVGECTRYHKGSGQISFDVRRIEYLLTIRNPTVREAMRRLYCPNCRMPVTTWIVLAADMQHR